MEKTVIRKSSTRLKSFILTLLVISIIIFCAIKAHYLTVTFLQHGKENLSSQDYPGLNVAGILTETLN